MDPTEQARADHGPHSENVALADCGDAPYFCVSTLTDENDHGGWSRKDRPVGGVPAKAPTAGSRGADDNAQPGDPAYE